MKMCAIYSILHFSFHNIFIEKDKYNEQQLCSSFSDIIFKLQKYYITSLEAKYFCFTDEHVLHVPCHLVHSKENFIPYIYISEWEMCLDNDGIPSCVHVHAYCLRNEQCTCAYDLNTLSHCWIVTHIQNVKVLDQTKDS